MTHVPVSEALGDEGTLASSRYTPATAPGEGPGELIEAGTVIGRYVVLHLLGAGAMGVVYAAFDPELDRKVALKLLHPRALSAGRGTSTHARTRLVREAQALAKLSHPNVVAVHDVGTHGDRVWLAMEFVAGRTLREWMATPHRWIEVVTLFEHAGRGLAAAHARGLVHRDFKPDNVMIDEDGRVRVMDFGLARRDGVEGDAEDSDPLSSADRRSLSLQVTQSGALVGTPAYMAPEQFRAGEVGPSADQFGFCVSLWEALHGQRPFAGSTTPELAASVLAGTIRAPPRGRRVPGWLDAVVQRGLSGEIDRRWPDLEALLAAFGRGRRRARRRWVVLGVGVCAAALAAGLTLERANERARIEDCAATASEIDEVWNDGARQHLRGALEATGLGYASSTAEKIMPWLDGYAEAWGAARVEVCMATDVRGEWDPATLDRALWCLDDRRLQFESLLEELGRGESGALMRAVSAAASLERTAVCHDPALLQRLPSPPSRDREALREVRRQLSRSANLEAIGDFELGLQVASAALVEAEAIAWGPLVAAGRYRVGSLLEDHAKYPEAVALLEQAYFGAVAVGESDLAFRAANGLVTVVGDRLAQHDAGMLWSRHAELALRNRGDADRLGRATLLDRRAGVEESAGDLTGARDHIEAALAIREGVLGSDHPEVAATVADLANIMRGLGEHDRAKQLHLRALELREATLGPDHPEVAASLNNLANVDAMLGNFAAAKPRFEAAVAILERGLGPNHPHVATGLDNLGNIHYSLGEYDESRRLHEQALAIREQVYGPDHVKVASSLGNLALVEGDSGNSERAIELHHRSLAIREKLLPPDHPDIGISLDNLGMLHFNRGEFVEARSFHERALLLRESSLGADHPEVGVSLVNLANVQAAAGEHEAARAGYQRALPLLERGFGPEHADVAYAHMGLAELALAERDLEAAIDEAELAIAILSAAEGAESSLADARFILAQALADTDSARARPIPRPAAIP